MGALPVKVPTEVKDLSSHNIVSVKTGDGKTLALAIDGTMFQWTSSGSVHPVFTPFKARKIFVGLKQNYALTRNNQIIVWEFKDASSPQLFEPLKNFEVETMTVSSTDSICFVTRAKEVYQYHRNQTEHKIVHLESLSNRGIVQVESGHSHFLALTNDGTLFSWGNNQRGQCGFPSELVRPNPQQLPFRQKTFSPLTTIACGLWHSAALTLDGVMYTWGDNR